MMKPEHKEALQHLITDYWTVWIQSDKQELPDWFYTVLDFMETEGRLRFNSVSGAWEEA